MKVEARIFELLTIFFFAIGTLYLILSQEPAGSAALYLTGGLSLLVGTYFRFVARRLESPRPEDNPAGEVSDGAGDVGFFSPGSYWPIILAGSVALMAISLAFMYFWAIAISAIILLICVGWAALRVPRPPVRPLTRRRHPAYEAHGELAVASSLRGRTVSAVAPSSWPSHPGRAVAPWSCRRTASCGVAPVVRGVRVLLAV